jgi:hypothetical protein
MKAIGTLLLVVLVLTVLVLLGGLAGKLFLMLGVLALRLLLGVGVVLAAVAIIAIIKAVFKSAYAAQDR